MNVMFDTCVILDFLLDRQSFGDDRRSHSKTQQLIGDILVKNNRYETSKIYVHTPSGSPAEEYMKKYNGVYVVNDYPAGG